jgi:hypothetical protein
LDIGKISLNQKEKRDSTLFLKEFFSSMVLDDPSLEEFRGAVDETVNGFSQEYDDESCSHMMFILDDWAKAKYKDTGKDHWKNVPSVHFEDSFSSDMSAEEPTEDYDNLTASDWSEEEENSYVEQAIAELLPRKN